MIFAHLPAGYLFSKLVAGRAPDPRIATACALLGSILPDFDLAYDWLIDPQNGGHRLYITHTPMFWIAVAALAWIVLDLAGRTAYAIYIWITLASILLCHLALDTLSSNIRWLYPFSNQEFNIIHVPWTGGSWTMTYFSHWSFWFEIMLIFAAASALIRSKLTKNHYPVR